MDVILIWILQRATLSVLVENIVIGAVALGDELKPTSIKKVLK